MVCLDRRMLGRGGGTGVATYAANLETAVREAGYGVALVSDRGVSSPGELPRLRRWAEAAMPWPRTLIDEDGPPGGSASLPLLGDDSGSRGRSVLLPSSLGLTRRSPPTSPMSRDGSDGRVEPGHDEPAVACPMQSSSGTRGGSDKDAGCAATGFKHDIFRIAQVHFDIHRRFVRLRPPRPPALMHWSYPLPLRLLGCPNVVTVHDLIPLRLPHLSPVPHRRWRRLLARLRHEADHIVTVSEASRRDIIAELGWPPERVTNTLQSIDLPDRTEAEAAAATGDAARQAGVQPGRYLIHVGTVESRKNIARLIEAHRASNVPYPLVLAGPDGWQAEAELRSAPAGAGDHRIVRVPWLPRAALLGLMRGARALLAPSLAEGFGLPAVEAMALGVPVLTSAIDATGHPGATAEIAGDAALLVDPRNGGEMAQGIAALATDDALRDRLIALGLNRARLYSRPAYADRLRTLYAAIRATPASRSRES